MKKIFTLFLGVIFAVNVWAEELTVDSEFTQGYLKYKILTLDEENETYTVSVVGHTDDLPTELTIPSSVEYDNQTSLTVTEIAENTFLDAQSITSVTIPATITTIGNNAFGGCSALETVSFGDNSQLKEIVEYAFIGCTSLTSIEIPSSVKEIGWFAFGDCSALETVTFGEDFSPEYFNMYTFYNCKSLTKIEIPSSVTIIGSNVFEGCTALEEVVFGENSSLEIIYPSVFLNCTSLTKIEIPSGVTTIDEYAFSGCSALEDVTLPQAASIGENCFEGCSLSSLTITDETMTTTLQPTYFDVEENSGCVLYVNEGLEREYYEAGWATYFTINNYIEGTEIADKESGLTYEITDQYENGVTIVVFDCSASVTIPASITYNDVEYTITAVANGVFDCSNLKEVTMEATVPPFDATAFEKISDVAVLIVPKGAKEAYSSWSDNFIEILDGTESSTALINLNSEKKEVVRYNLLGQKINAPVCGINIIKYSDGTVKKVFVK